MGDGSKLQHKESIDQSPAMGGVVAIRLPLLSLAWARKNTARAADVGIAGLFIVGIAVPVIDHDRFAACLAGMMMFRCGGRLD